MNESASDRFASALCFAVSREERGFGGIGTLKEGTLHAVLKHYLEPDTACHERKVGSYFADIRNAEGITEIQTRQWGKLRQKLEAFLPLGQVTLVFPAAYRKWLLWIEEESGEVTKRRLSPKRGTVCEVFPELYAIRSYLTHPNLRIRVILLELEEYRLLNGWSRDRKKGSWRSDRVPLALCEEVLVECAADYSLLIPDGLPKPFRSKDFSKKSGLSLKSAQKALCVLTAVSAVSRVGKDGNAILYTLNSDTSDAVLTDIPK